MEFQKQRTIRKEVSLQGAGLHTGNSVEMKFKPSPVNSGINFVRVDLPERPVIRAHLSNVIDQSKSPRRTSVGIEGVEVHTIEHLMAALSSLAIDNITIEINGIEVPGLDGSATPFFEILKRAEIVEQDQQKKLFQVREAVWIEDRDSSITILPANDFRITYILDYDNPFLKSQYFTLQFDSKTFEQDIASSRTFCLEQEADELRKQGLGKGADYENTLVVGKNGVIKNKLRFVDEFARHKILDLVGDLYLLGFSLLGHIVAIKSGHPLNLKLLQKIERQRKGYEVGGITAECGSWSAKQMAIPPIDIMTIMKILPHRPPFLFIDRILEFEEGKRAVGVRNVTINDNFFAGHFPGKPVMPGVLIIEALAQVAGVLMLSRVESAGKLAYFMSMDNVKFRKTVVPGDQLLLIADVVRLKSRTAQVYTRALVEDKIAAEAELMFSLV